MSWKYFTSQGFQSWKKLEVSIDVVEWLVFQDYLRNQDNFLELIKLLASYNEDMEAIVSENALQNAHKIQGFIREETEDSKFCIIVYEAHDEQKKEQTTVILQFFYKEGFICERFFDLIHVKDTTSLALKKAICEVLLRHLLNVDDIRGQGHDGASNMHNEWNDLQVLFTKKDIEAFRITELIENCELETGNGKNQGSHLTSLNSLIRMLDSVCVILQDIIKSSNLTQRSKTDGIYDSMTSIEFVFILHIMIEMLGINDDLLELLVISSALNLHNNYKAFYVEDICKVMNDFYPDDFTKQEKLHMKILLEHFQLNAYQSTIYPLLDRIIRLVLTLPMSTTTIERAFSTLKIVNIKLHNRIKYDFLSTYLVVYIEKGIAQEF
ncbi:hypothetical protein V6Z11_A02G163100 [Gossypium hirsutum]